MHPTAEGFFLYPRTPSVVYMLDPAGDILFSFGLHALVISHAPFKFPFCVLVTFMRQPINMIVIYSSWSRSVCVLVIL